MLLENIPVDYSWQVKAKDYSNNFKEYEEATELSIYILTYCRTTNISKELLASLIDIKYEDLIEFLKIKSIKNLELIKENFLEYVGT